MCLCCSINWLLDKCCPLIKRPEAEDSDEESEEEPEDRKGAKSFSTEGTVYARSLQNHGYRCHHQSLMIAITHHSEPNWLLMEQDPCDWK